ncbi:MAG: DeoR family transcriptional regulator [Chloroflexi bacterium]|nr:DeoR family transcriptional regulator [Chloroflexota bacterium]
MNNLTPRQREILKIVNQKGDLSVEHLRQEIEMSQATAYREIQDLTQMGLINKVSGGISKVESSPQRCVQCGRDNNPRTSFMIELTDGEKLVACCAHCGLMALANRTNIKTAMTTDFFYGRLLNANHAWYVLNSRVSLCCQPSTLIFSNPEDAKQFTLGFGGEAVDFSEAQQKIKEMMAFKTVIHKI